MIFAHGNTRTMRLEEANRRLANALDQGEKVQIGRKPHDGDSGITCHINKGPRDNNARFDFEDGEMCFYFPDANSVPIVADCLKIGEGRFSDWYQIVPPPPPFIRRRDLNAHWQAVKGQYTSVFTEDGYKLYLAVGKGSFTDTGSYEGEFHFEQERNGTRSTKTLPIVAINFGAGFTPVIP